MAIVINIRKAWTSMVVNILREEGYNQALLGLSLAYKDQLIPMNEWWSEKRRDKMYKVAQTLAFKGGGHSKFLESLTVWLYVKAPRYWWQEFDTYRVGMTKQSGSTMHTLLKRALVQEDFSKPIDQMYLEVLNSHIEIGNFTRVKQSLPESFLQERVVCTNYKTLQNIVFQRQSHRLKEWQEFISDLKQLQYKEFIFNG